MEQGLIERAVTKWTSSATVRSMLSGLSFGHSESHLDSARPIAQTCFHVAIQTEPEPATAQLDSRAKTDSAFLRIGKGGAIDLVVCQLLQPITVEPKDAETYERIVIDGTDSGAER